MNCRDWEERIALYAGGDLPREEAAEAEAHLQDCASCREFAAALREHTAWMREAHEEWPATMDFAAMRAGVLARLERRRRPVAWGLLWASSLVATTVVVLLLWHTPRSEPARKPAPQVGDVAKTQVPMAESPSRPRPAQRRRQRPLRRAQEPPAPLLVKLITDDPDVVIYWIVDPKGD